jgi:hypothetical protein
MTTTHDDMPHPVPPIAYLRYKENWFFLIFDEPNDVFGAIHVVSEPGFERLRLACHLSVRGELFAYGNQVPFPTDFAMAPELGDGAMAVRFVKAHEQIDLSLHDDDVDLEISFLGRSPAFTFESYDHSNPDRITVPEVMNFASNQQNVHQQQGMRTRGELAVKTGELAGTSFTIDALGYRDHSRSIRSDNMVHRHFWTGLQFPTHTFGAMQVSVITRPDVSGVGGYVYDDRTGLRALRDIEITGAGDGPGGVPAKVEWKLTDVYGEAFTIEADLTQRFAHVPLKSESAGAIPFVYEIIENFAPLKLQQSGEDGIGLVEVGRSVPADAAANGA